MKVYSISKWTFWGIVLLILLLPVSRHWKLLIGGERTTGTVSKFTLYKHETYMGENVLIQVSEIYFQVGDSTIVTHGPADYELAPGRTVTIRYNPNSPSMNCIVTFGAFYLTNYTVLIIILLATWLAFATSYNRYRKKTKPGQRKPVRRAR